MSFEEEQEQVERIYIDMENRLLLNIAKKIARGKPMEIDRWDEETGQPIYGSGGVNEWQLERLKELNGLNKENAKIIASYSKKTVEEIEKIFDRAREIGTASDKRILEMGVKAGILNEIDPTDESKQVKKIIKHAIREVLTTFNKQNNSLLASAGEEYKEIVNTVSSKVLSGNKTVGNAIQEAVSRLAEKGLTGFTARNGAKWTPEAYTKMIMRTNTQNTINNIQEERLALAGNDYIEISKHSGARPKCADDQGQIFSLSGNTKPIVDGRGKKIKVRAWSSSSYGKPDGILGINCGHTRYAFVPNLSIHREPEFTKAENDADYLEKQQQRLYERSIRKKKREIQMLEEIKADKDYIKKKNNQLRDYRKEYTGFLNKTGRTRISSNEWIGNKKTFKGLSGSNNISKVAKDHSKHVLLEKIPTNSKSISKTIKKYEIIIKNDIIENAIVITVGGDVYQCFGNATSVYPDIDLGEKLFGAIVTHNHPAEETSYSFSENDIKLFEKFKLSKLRGIDNKYIYELDRNNPSNLEPPKFGEDIEDNSLYHLQAIQYAIDNNISYRRWKNDQR